MTTLTVETSGKKAATTLDADYVNSIMDDHDDMKKEGDQLAFAFLKQHELLQDAKDKMDLIKDRALQFMIRYDVTECTFEGVTFKRKERTTRRIDRQLMEARGVLDEYSTEVTSTVIQIRKRKAKN